MKSRVVCRVLPLVISVSAAACSSGQGSPVASEDAVDAPLGATSEPLIGTTDTSDKAVLAVVSATQTQVGLCTGTLIAPNLVLTARHCVETVPAGAVNCAQTKFTPPKGNQDVLVSTSSSLHGSVPYYPVSEVHVPPDGSSVCGNDIALLVLAQPFPAATLQPIAVQLDAPVGTGDVYTAIGFGLAAVQGTEGVRRSKAGLSVVCGASSCASQGTVSATEFVGADSICEGDSGGPAIDTEGSVIGIVSRGADNCGLAIYSAVAPWGSWIDDVAKGAATLGQYTLPSWFGGTDGSGTKTAATTGDTAASGAVSATANPGSNAATTVGSSDGSSAVGPMLTTPSSQQASTGGGCDLAAPGRGAAGSMPAGLTFLFGLGWVAWCRRPRPVL